MDIRSGKSSWKPPCYPVVFMSNVLYDRLHQRSTPSIRIWGVSNTESHAQLTLQSPGSALSLRGTHFHERGVVTAPGFVSNSNFNGLQNRLSLARLKIVEEKGWLEKRGCRAGCWERFFLTRTAFLLLKINLTLPLIKAFSWSSGANLWLTAQDCGGAWAACILDTGGCILIHLVS